MAEEERLRKLMVRYQQADPAAMTELVDLLSPRLLHFLARERGDRNQAEDLLQDCWMQIHRSRHTYRPSEPVLPWVFAIARHVRVDAYRRASRRQAREVLVAQVPDVQEHSSAVRRFTPREFEGLLDNLPESQREVIHMLKISGMSLEEVARATSSTVGAVKQKAHRAYATLRLAFGKE